MDSNTVTTFFALLALMCDTLIIAVAIAFLTRRSSLVVDVVGPIGLSLAALIAVVATLGSLYLSEVAHFVPCRLCWYQRIGMYPLAVLLPIAAFRKDVRAWPYLVALPLAALPISLYHVLLERVPSLETSVCEVDNPCSIVWVRHFGVVTIPFMAASAFGAIAISVALAVVSQRKELHHVVA
jgi:disulfide bond formation protein DsbB